MSNIIIYDVEVFSYNTLLGAYILKNDGIEVYQSWNLDDIKRFYDENVKSIWVGHNNSNYDNFILQAIVKGKNETQIKKINDILIKDEKRMYLDIPLYYYDLMSKHPFSLKMIEAYTGKNISETKVDFNIDRPLTDEEKKLTESYNRDDLNQTYENFINLNNDFSLKLDVINEFKLPIEAISFTGTRLAEEVLHATKINDIESWIKLPTIWPNLQVKNKDVIDFYLSRRYAKKETLHCTLCGTDHILAAGGIHGAKKKYYCKEAFYFDVSGYYNLIMINLDLLPRSIPTEYKELYKYMYHEQLKLKKKDPRKRGVYKTILLSVFGAMNNKYCRFYDPYYGDLVRLSGEMYIVDLLEKLEGKVEVIQSNTDGVIAKLLPGTREEEMKAIIDEWQERTGFVLKFDKIYDIYQRDVNCYFYRDKDGNINVHGEAVKDYSGYENPFEKNSYESKEPLIMAECIVNYYMNNILPEDTIKKNMRNLQKFQYICKLRSFDWMEYEVEDLDTHTINATKVQHVNRAFALNSEKIKGMLYKHKNDGKKVIVANLPDSIFLYDDEILSDEAVDKLQNKINWQFYVDRAYERINEFMDIPMVKEICYE